MNNSATQLPLISVVMATYNGELFIVEQLDSILQQTYPAIELIIVDDGSEDSTVAILKQYAEKYPVLKLVQNETRLGYIKNFEKGMLLAQGDLIALSDQDDIWMKEKLSTLFTQLGNSEIIYSNSELIDDAGNSLHKKMSDIRNQIGYNDCLMYTIGAWAPGHAMLFRKELIARCLPFSEIVTHDFWLGFVATCKAPIKYIDTPLVQYRQHQANVIGAVKVSNDVKLKKKKVSKQEKLKNIRNRMRLLYLKCPAGIWQKKVFQDINESYQNFSLHHNFIRMRLFFTYRHQILAYKKKSGFMKILFCLKMFFKID